MFDFITDTLFYALFTWTDGNGDFSWRKALAGLAFIGLVVALIAAFAVGGTLAWVWVISMVLCLIGIGIDALRHPQA